MNIYDQVILENQAFKPFFHNGFSNHRSMVLYCLKEMGASDDVLQYQAGEERWSYYKNKYALPFETIETHQNRIHDSNWKNHIGSLVYFPDYLNWLNSTVLNTNLITETLATLKQDISAALFHPLIRFSMGIDDQKESEVAMALAYWLSVAKPLKKNIQTSINVVDCIQKILCDFQHSVNFSSLHYLTSYIAITKLPSEIQNTISSHYYSELYRYVESNNFNISEEINIEASNIHELAKEEAFKSADDHVIKGIYALLELDKIGNYTCIDASIVKLMNTLY